MTPYKDSDKKKEHMREYGRRYRKENREKLREYHRSYYLENKKRIKKRRADYRRKRPEVARRGVRKYAKTRKLLLKTLLGDVCVLCGGVTMIGYHEVHGRKHPKSKSYYLTHYKDFVPLCNRCHYTLHRINWFGSIEKFNELCDYLANVQKNEIRRNGKR